MIEVERSTGSARSKTKKASKPDVLQFLDYREYLKRWLEWKRSIQPKYSGSLFARKAGLQAHTLLGMVVRGQRNLSYSSLHGFLRALELNGKRACYFEKLVYYNQAKNPEDKERFFHELLSINKSSANRELKSLSNYSSLLSSWYVVVIRELVHFADFEPDPKWIADHLPQKISKKQIEESWQILSELNLVKFDEKTKKFLVTDKALEIDPRVSDFSLKNYHRQNLKLAEEYLEGDERGKREFSSLTLAVYEKQLASLRQKINKFRKDINSEFSQANEEPDHVVSLNSQLLVLSSKQKNKEDGANGC